MEDPRKNLDEDIEYVSWIRDSEDKVVGYELHYWNPDANYGEGSFMHVRGSVVNVLLENKNYLGNEIDRKEWWCDYGTKFFDEVFAQIQDPSNFDYVGKHGLSELRNIVFAQTQPNLDKGYACLSENVVIRPDDALQRVFVRQLDIDGCIYFSDLHELDENGNTVMFAKNKDGVAGIGQLISDNYFANEGLLESLEDVWAGRSKPDYIDYSVQCQLDDIAENNGWEKDGFVKKTTEPHETTEVEVGFSGVSIDTKTTTIQDLINDWRIEVLDFLNFFDNEHGCEFLYDYDIERRSTIVSSLQNEVEAEDFSNWESMKILHESGADFFFDNFGDIEPIDTKEAAAKRMFNSFDLQKTIFEFEKGLEPGIDGIANSAYKALDSCETHKELAEESIEL